MKGKFTSVILAVVLVVITVGTVFFGYSKASGKAAKSSVEGEQRYAWPLATCSTEDTITHIFATQFAKEVEKLSSCQAAPVLLVTTPMHWGTGGSGRLRSGAKRPSASSFLYRASKAIWAAPAPKGFI